MIDSKYKGKFGKEVEAITPASIYTKLFQNDDLFPFDTAAKADIAQGILTAEQNSIDYVDSTYRADEINLSSISAQNAPAPLALPSYDGDTQGTHPSVLFFEVPWNGYQYWMAYTPHTYGDPTKENPSILASNDKINWVVPPGLTNPLEPAPTDGTFWADTHLLYDEDNDRLICYYRGFEMDRSLWYIYANTSTDGSTWGAKIKVLEQPDGGGSPVIIKDAGQFVMYDIDFINEPHRIFKRTSTDPLDFQAAVKTECTFDGMPPGKEIWHFDIRKVRGYLYCVMMDTITGTNGSGGGAVFGIVKDNHFHFPGYEFLSQKGSGWVENRLYRGTFLPSKITREGIEFEMWYGGVDVARKWQIGNTTLFTYFSSFSIDFGQRNSDYILRPEDNRFSLEGTSINDQVFTFPNFESEKIPVGFEVDLIQGNFGRIIPVSEAGVNFRLPEGIELKSAGINSIINVKKIAINTFLLSNGLLIEAFLLKINYTNTNVLTALRGSTATYMDENSVIKTAEIDELRIDYATGYPMILIETEDTNIIQYSEDFTNAYWEKGNITLTDASLTLSTGTVKLTNIKGASDYQSFSRSFTKTAVKTKYFIKILVKKGDSELLLFLITDSTNNNRLNCSFYYNSNIISFTEIGDFQIESSKITQLKNDLVLIEVEFITDASASARVRIYDRIPENPNGIYISYVQITEKSSSYIKTSGSEATRDADIVTIDTPAGTNKIIERLNGEQENVITTIPTSYQLPNGRIKEILFKK